MTNILGCVVCVLFALLFGAIGVFALFTRAEEKKRNREVEELRQKYEAEAEKEMQKIEENIKKTEKLNTGSAKSDFNNSIDILQELSDRR